MGKSSKTIVVAARIPPELDAILKTLAAQWETTKAAVIVTALNRYCAFIVSLPEQHGHTYY